jgi:hypothetical protein
VVLGDFRLRRLRLRRACDDRAARTRRSTEAGLGEVGHGD